MDRLRVQVLSSAVELSAFEPVWWELFLHTPDATPFQSPAWLLPWIETFVSEKRLRAIVVLEGRSLVGLLPLVIVDEAGGRVARIAGSGTSDYLDALIEPRRRDAVGRAMSQALYGVAEEVDRVDLTDVPGSSLVPALLAAEGARSPCAVCPRLPLTNTYAEHLSQIPAWFRRNLRQGEARLGKASAIFELARMTTGARLIEAFFHVHGLRWRSRGEPGVLEDPSIRAFHKRAAPRLLSRGLLELSAAFVDGQPIAAAYVLTHRNAHLYLTGFDPRYERMSAGSVMIGRAVERAFAARRRYFDFLRGPEPYKYVWGARDSVTLRMCLERRKLARASGMGFTE